MSIPKKAGLLTPLDTPRNQGAGNRECGYFGCRKALEVMLDRSPVYAGKRISYEFLRYIAQDTQGVYGASGTSPAALARALDTYGFCWEEDYSSDGQRPSEAAYKAAARNKPIRLVPMPYLSDDTTGAVSPRYWISRGYSLLAVVLVHPGYSQVSGPTSTHTWDSSGTPIDEHITCFSGFDEARIIAADSGAGSYGDSRGRVGFTNDKFMHGPQRCVSALWMFVDGPARPKPVEGYMPEPAKLTLSELGPEVAFARATLKAAEAAATNARRIEWTERVLRRQPANAVGWQWAIDALVAEGLTDRQADICIGGAPGDFLKLADSMGLDSSKLAKDIG